ESLHDPAFRIASLPSLRGSLILGRGVHLCNTAQGPPLRHGPLERKARAGNSPPVTPQSTQKTVPAAAGPVVPPVFELRHALRRLDDPDHVARRAQLRPGEEHAADATPLGLGPGDVASVIVVEPAGEDLLAVASI